MVEQAGFFAPYNADIKAPSKLTSGTLLALSISECQTDSTDSKNFQEISLKISAPDYCAAHRPTSL